MEGFVVAHHGGWGGLLRDGGSARRSVACRRTNGAVTLAAKKRGGKSTGSGKKTTKKDSPGAPAATPTAAAKQPETPPAPEKKQVSKKTAKDFIAEGVTDDVKGVDMVSFDGDLIPGAGKLNLPNPGDDDPSFSRFEESLLAGITAGVQDKANPFIDGDGSSAASDGTGIGEEGGVQVDLAGDGGVMKEVLVKGSGSMPKKGAKVTLSYTGTLLDSGKEFDSTTGKDPFSFTLGSGQVIKGWEVGVASMSLGEQARLTLTPGYGYGRRGAPPVIGPNAGLVFEVELLRVEVPDEVAKTENILSSQTFAEDNPLTARTPDDIANAYFSKLAKGKEDKAKSTAGGIKGFLDQFYFISPFASQTGERPPWYLNPNITFVSVFVLVGLAFYVVYVAGGVRLGYVGQEAVDVNIFK